MAEPKNKTAGDGKKKTETAAAKSEDAKTADSAASTASESGGAEAAKDPATGYSRGENQKPISKAYKSNWDNIFGKKKRAGR
ncbi:MAG: hypothetical protein HOH66_13035 [Rhodospirillaceae bacterium]|jgi:hypothetical protein|nr:hypothetical protein [Rhodospirillaceae bacterium]MBT6118783.1 hypothetical protein [Rhodospirillaceae bacterium]